MTGGRPRGEDGRISGGALALAAASVGVVVVLVAALAVLDSPAEERRQCLDDRRVENLHGISDVIDRYRHENGSLPPDLATLDEWQGPGDLPRDPVTDEPYRYEPTGDRTYRLCATFATEGPQDEGRRWYPYEPTEWHHPAGEHCFEREAEEL